jgi:hypothetical protein
MKEKDPRTPLIAGGVLVALFAINSGCEGPQTPPSTPPVVSKKILHLTQPDRPNERSERPGNPFYPSPTR